MLILFTSYLSHGKYKLESIGEYNKKHNEGMNGPFDKYCNYFKEIAALDNSIKHHFSNDLIKEISLDEPRVICLYCKDNWNMENATVIDKSLNEIVRGFNEFHRDMIKYINSGSIGNT